MDKCKGIENAGISGVEALAEVADLGRHARGEVGGGGSLADDVAEGGADDDAVGHGRELLGVGAVADAEAEADGQGADGLDLGGVLADGFVIQAAFAGGAGFGHEVEEAAGFLRDLFHAVGASRGGDEENDLDVGSLERGAQRAGFLGRQIHDEQAVDSGRVRGLGEAVEAVLEERVVVAEEHDRNFGLAPQAGGEVEGFRQRHAGLERALGGFLDDGAVGSRIGERHAEFENVDAGAAGGAEDFEARLRIRVAGGQVADEGFFLGGGESLERFRDAIHRGFAFR